MDDIFNQQRSQTPVEEAWHTEQKRKQYDIIRVHNPTNEDFYVEYDVRQHQRIPANSSVDVPRYIAERYVKHMHDKLVHTKAQQMHDAFIEDRRRKGLPDYKDKAIENSETYETASYPKSNDPVLIAQNMDILWVGVVHEFGRDKLPESGNSRQGEVDLTPPFIQAIKNLGNRRVEMDPQTTVTRTPAPNFYANPQAPVIESREPNRFAALNEKLSASEITTDHE